MKSPLRLLGILFTIIGLPFLIGGLTWINFIIENQDDNTLELYIGPIVFSLVGFVFATVGVGILLSQRRQRLKREMLMKTGRKIKGTIVSIAKNQNIKVNNRHPHMVICAAKVSGVEKKFTSSNIYGSLLLNKGDELDIYLDFRNHDNYWVEIPNSSLANN